MSLQLACAGKLGNKRNQGAVMGCVMGSCAVTYVLLPYLLYFSGV